jgi:hypothetical protein
MLYSTNIGMRPGDALDSTRRKVFNLRIYSARFSSEIYRRPPD